MRVCQLGGVTFFMYGWAAFAKPKMSMTSTSFAVRRVCVTVLRSLAFTTDISTVMLGYLVWNVLLKASMNSTMGGFWWTRTFRVTFASAGAAAAGA